MDALRAASMDTVRAASSLLLLVAVTVLAGLQIRHLQPDWDLESFFAEGTPERDRYEQMRAAFGRDDRTGILLVSRDEPLAADDYHALARATDRLASLPEVESVRSPTNLKLVLRGDDGRTHLEDALPDGFDADRFALAMARMSEPPYVRVVRSEDGRSVVLAATLRPERVEVADRALLRDHLEQEADRLEAEGFHVRTGGYPVQRAILTEHIGAEAGRLFPWVAAVLAVVLAVSLRSVTGVVLPLVTVGLAIVWTAGAMAAFDLQPNLFATAVYTLVLVYGVSDPVHVLARYGEVVRSGEMHAVRATLRQVAWPCFLTSATTALGFLSLALAPIPAIAVFGLQVAIGVACAWAVTFSLVPAVLFFASFRTPSARDSGPGSLERLLSRLDAVVASGPWRAVAASALVTAVFATGIPRIEVDSPLLADLAPDHPILETNRMLEERMCGVLGLEVVLPPLETGQDTFSSERMHEIDRLTQRLRALPNVLLATSAVDPLHHFARQLDAERDPWSLLPAALLLASEELAPWVDEETDVQRIRVTMRNVSTKDALRLFDDIEQTVGETLGIDGRGTLTGAGYVGQMVNARMVTYLGWSFAAALLSILLTLVIGLGPRKALHAVLPNLFPIVVVCGFMGWYGIDLRYTSALVLTVVFGLVVDDTIHLLAALRRETADPVRDALVRAGPGMVMTSLTLAAGFSVLLASTFVPNQVLGGLLVVTAASALFGDLVLLPAQLRIAKP